MIYFEESFVNSYFYRLNVDSVFNFVAFKEALDMKDL